MHVGLESCGGFEMNSDHKAVIMNMKLNWKMTMKTKVEDDNETCGI